MRKTWWVGPAVAAVLAFPLPAHAETADVQDALTAYQAEVGPGAGVHGGDHTGSWEFSAGTATVGTDRPITSTDHYRIGSQTKTFTAVVTMQLVDEGKVVLDEPIERYLPGVVTGNGHDGSVITVRHLLQHTSGIPTNDLPTPVPRLDGTFALEELVRDGLRHPSVSAPGAEFHYSNTNYEILGLMVEAVTGNPVGQEITDRIIRPLGLHDTTYPEAGDRSLPDPLVHGYVGGRVPPLFLWLDATAFEPSLFGPAGGMISTQQDITRFYQALLAGELTSPESLAEMRTTVPVEGAPDLAVGLGLFAKTLPCGAVTWGHDGMVPGFASHTDVTADGRHVTTVTNSNIGSAKVNDVITAAICG